MTGRFAATEILGGQPNRPPETTAMGALLNHVTGGANAETFQPMNINFGLFPRPPEEMLRVKMPNGRKRKVKGKDRKKLYTDIARKDMDAWLSKAQDAAE